MADSPRLRTARLVLEVPEPDAAPRVAAFYERNKDHFAPWDPPHPPRFFTEAYWREKLAQSRLELLQGQSLRFFLVEGELVIGTCNFTSFVRGPFQACYLGYSIDKEREGKGLMAEAVRAATAYVFSETKLHRIMANHVPENLRSARLLRRLGFVVEGYARDYLYINGAWRDHVLTSLTNPAPMTP